MRRVCLGLVFMLALAGFARPASATVITFNEAGLVPGLGSSPTYLGTPKGTALTDQLANLGVVFSVSNGMAYVSNDTYIGYTGFSQNSLAVNSTPSGPWATLSASFIDPLSRTQTTANGFSVAVADGNAGAPRMEVKAYDLAGNWLESFALTSFMNTFQFNSSNIARIDFIDTGGDGHVLDNFKFTLNQPTSVPEPASMSLFAVGGAVLAFARRRRRQ